MKMNNRGMTLVELMIAMTLAAFVMVGVYQSFNSQKRVFTSQGQVTNIQQNLRAAISIMSSSLRLAAYTGDPANNDLFKITAAQADSIVFTYDDDNDGAIDAEELYDFNLYNPGYTVHGVALNTTSLRMRAGGNAIADHIEIMSILYAIDTDGDDKIDVASDLTGSNSEQILWVVPNTAGTRWVAVDTNDDGVITAADDDGDGVIDEGDSGSVASFDVDDIMAVRISLLARAEVADSDRYFVNQNQYVVGNRIFNANDSFRRRLLTTTVILRNKSL